MHVTDDIREPLPSDRSRRQRPGPPLVEPGGRDLEDPTRGLDRRALVGHHRDRLEAPFGERRLLQQLVRSSQDLILRPQRRDLPAGRDQLRALRCRQTRSLPACRSRADAASCRSSESPIPRSCATSATLRPSANNSSTLRRNSAGYLFGTMTSPRIEASPSQKPERGEPGEDQVSTRTGQLQTPQDGVMCAWKRCSRARV